MSNTNLFIPEKIKIGFQKREDTYTGKLAYVIYFDEKGTLRKEKSWQSWRDHKIEPIEIENKPTEGFVLNKNVGGYKSDWHYRQSHIRVYDPRDFEFEIDLPNLLFILKECDCNKGKGLEGKFVFAWDGTELVLLPVGCEDYRKSQGFTDLQAQSVAKADLLPGHSYLTKQQTDLVFIGHLPYHWLTDTRAMAKKRYVFWNPAIDPYTKKPYGFVYFDDLKKIAKCFSDSPFEELAKRTQQYMKSNHGSKIVRLYLDKGPKNDNEYLGKPWAFEQDGWLYSCHTEMEHGGLRVRCVRVGYGYRMNGSVLEKHHDGSYLLPPKDQKPAGAYWGQEWPRTSPWREPTDDRLWAELESGAKFILDSYSFGKDQ